MRENDASEFDTHFSKNSLSLKTCDELMIFLIEISRGKRGMSSYLSISNKIF